MRKARQSVVKRRDDVLRHFNRKFLGAARDIGSEVALSPYGSLIATGGRNSPIKLWSGDKEGQDLRFIETPDLSSLKSINCLVFSPCRLLAIGTTNAGITLYDVESYSFIATITFQNPTAVAFSKGGHRLVAGNEDGFLRLWDILTIIDSAHTSQEISVPVTALVFSPDCSRLVSGSEDGTIQVWDTSSASEPIGICRGHLSKITTLAFTPNGSQFASGDANGFITFWCTDDCAPSSAIQWQIAGELTSVAFSDHLEAAATKDTIVLWNRHQRSCLDRLGDCGSILLSFSNHNENLLLASFNDHSNTVTVWDVGSCTPHTTFSVGKTIERMVFYPDDSHLFVHDQGGGDGLWIFDIVNKLFPNDVPISESVDKGVVPCWKGIPVWMCCSNDRYFIRGRFSQGDCNYISETVCQLPEDIDVVKGAYGSNMFALLCRDGRLLLLQSD